MGSSGGGDKQKMLYLYGEMENIESTTNVIRFACLCKIGVKTIFKHSVKDKWQWQWQWQLEMI